ncbi:MAG: hypothetical protein ABIG95_04125 [Candidatus Woesearchaeota archaeon]
MEIQYIVDADTDFNDCVEATVGIERLLKQLQMEDSIDGVLFVVDREGLICGFIPNEQGNGYGLMIGDGSIAGLAGGRRNLAIRVEHVDDAALLISFMTGERFSEYTGRPRATVHPLYERLFLEAVGRGGYSAINLDQAQ